MFSELNFPYAALAERPRFEFLFFVFFSLQQLELAIIHSYLLLDILRTKLELFSETMYLQGRASSIIFLGATVQWLYL